MVTIVTLIILDAICFSKIVSHDSGFRFLQDRGDYCQYIEANIYGDQVTFNLYLRKMYYSDRKSTPANTVQCHMDR